MNRWMDEVSGAAAGILALTFLLSFVAVGAVVIGGIAFLTVEGYHLYKRRHDPPRLGPWSEPGDTAAFGWDGGLYMGEEIRWQ